MSCKPDGGPAFPTGVDVLTDGLNGMSLRDYFAAMAMQGMIAATPNDAGPIPEDADKLWALGAYLIADAMLEARK